MMRPPAEAALLHKSFGAFRAWLSATAGRPGREPKRTNLRSLIHFTVFLPYRSGAAGPGSGWFSQRKQGVRGGIVWARPVAIEMAKTSYLAVSRQSHARLRPGADRGSRQHGHCLYRLRARLLERRLLPRERDGG